MPDNQSLLHQVGGQLAGAEALKASEPSVMTTTSMAVGGAGGFMNRPQVEALVVLAVSNIQWLGEVSYRLRDQRAGTVPTVDIDGDVAEAVTENAGKTITSSPSMDRVAYNCVKHQSTFYITLEDIGEARASGTSNFQLAVIQLFARKMAQSIGKAIMRGDKSITDLSTRENRLLVGVDGILKQARSKAIRKTTDYGKAYSRKVWRAMQQRMPVEYKDNPNLRWIAPPGMDEAFTWEVNEFAAQGNAAALAGLNQNRVRYNPNGIPALLVPQMPTTNGFTTLGKSAVAADAITSPASNVKAQVSSLFGGYDAAQVGRQVKITCNATGESETASVTAASSQLYVTTVGTLGQSSVSTSAADYTLDVVDCTSALLTDPKNICFVMCTRGGEGGVRVYRKFEQESERIRFDVYWEMDVLIFNPNALVLQDGIVVPVEEF